MERRFGERRFGGFRPRSFEKPVKEGQECDIEITEVGAKGDGIARVQGFVIFVPGGKKGEKVKIKIKQVMNKFAIGEKIGPTEKAPEAEAPVEAGEVTPETEGEVIEEKEIGEEETEEAPEELEETEEIVEE